MLLICRVFDSIFPPLLLLIQFGFMIMWTLAKVIGIEPYKVSHSLQCSISLAKDKVLISWPSTNTNLQSSSTIFFSDIQPTHPSPGCTCFLFKTCHQCIWKWPTLFIIKQYFITVYDVFTCPMTIGFFLNETIRNYLYLILKHFCRQLMKVNLQGA